uniref:Protein UL117 n=1 Tax=Mastomys natalensis cytomegalovirus 2 TaxID=2973540 RepID=A0A9Y1IMP3_9BETA|nr:protein UL117 [Mastomys natalensis cytomegalovirus 2]WEG69244.1 protein UL117 [Mastomys natalensis cytomegalovirus 2]WEG69383.1 protein UL117 [Mastomys natalensis cytomegalovirus 2]WEG69521.1 protein UL117 [Mastomys natalensis cytomegalovirus 2]WEG69659.1 protein UL117 [Mastomys natalensis cytomegalovirus 2]
MDKNQNIKFPTETAWSTIKYSRVTKPLLPSLSPANVSNDKIVVIRPCEGNSFTRIPPGETAWETRVRIVGPEAPQEAITRTIHGNVVHDDLTSESNIGTIDTRVAVSTNVNSRPHPPLDPNTLLTVIGIAAKSNSAGVVSRPNTENKLIVPVVCVPGKPQTEPTCLSIPSIIVRNVKHPTTLPRSDRSSQPTIPKCTEKSVKDMLRDLAVLCTVKRESILDIQLHFTCHRFRTARDTYDALCKIPNLKLIMGTQTFTERCKCRCPGGTRGPHHQPKPMSNVHTTTGPYEICVRSRTSSDLLEAARLCKYAAERTPQKCEFRISSNVHTYM